VIARGGPHWLEFMPPLGAAVVYLALYAYRFRRLAARDRAPGRWRVISFCSGVALLVAVQVGPADSLGDQILALHMAQHIVIGDVCSLLLVLGVTGPMLRPLLQVGWARPLRRLSHPLVAFALWALDLYPGICRCSTSSRSATTWSMPSSTRACCCSGRCCGWR
jgi:cytochrome c oxidase assembly factor CtaG